MKKKMYPIGVVIIIVLFIIGGCLFAQKNVNEAGYTEVADEFKTVTTHNSGNESKYYDLLNSEIKQILSSYEGVSSEFMIHCETRGIDISKVELTVKCNDNLPSEVKISIKKQLAELIAITEDDVLLKTISLAEGQMRKK